MGRYAARPSGVFAPASIPDAGEPPGLWKSKADVGFIELKYIGEEDEVQILAPSRRLYTFDNDEHKKVLVHPMDVNYVRYLGIAK